MRLPEAGAQQGVGGATAPFLNTVDAMLCRRCSGLESAAPSPQAPAAPAPTTLGVLSVVLCVRCGAPFGPEDLTAQHVAVLAELNRFGLTGRDGLLKAPLPETKSPSA